MVWFAKEPAKCALVGKHVKSRFDCQYLGRKRTLGHAGKWIRQSCMSGRYLNWNGAIWRRFDWRILMEGYGGKGTELPVWS